MARKNDNQEASAAGAPGSGAAAIAAEEPQPMRGGSYIRNEDGSLTQTEGRDFHDHADNRE